jgi:hypothetical protein
MDATSESEAHLIYMGETMLDHEYLPVEEMLAYEEFTDRVEILRELEAWVKNIQRMAAPSTALIAPRRMGKTVLLDRLVNTVFFKPEYRVAPFYFKMKREEITLREFLLEYATTFFRQYIAYCLQQPELYNNTDIEPEVKRGKGSRGREDRTAVPGGPGLSQRGQILYF